MATADQAKRVYTYWHEYAKTSDIDALLRLYASDALLESPLVTVLMKREPGICRGADELRAFFVEGTKRRPNHLVKWYRSDRYFFDGKTLIWEYPWQTPENGQIDIAEILDLDDEGLITHHRIYWGHAGVSELLRSMRADY